MIPRVAGGHILFIAGAIVAAGVVGYWAFDRRVQRSKKRRRGGRRY
jgi:hypothetical protein